MKKVVVIGGGITGLSAAYALQKAKEQGAGIDYLLVEKNEYLGGAILTVKKDGFTFECGPDCFISEKPFVAQMAAKLGITDRLMGSSDATRRTFIMSQGKLHELPEGMMSLVPTKIIPFAFSGLFSWPGKFRMALDWFIPKKKEETDESLAEFVRRRLGQEALDKIAEPLIGGVHAGDPEKMSVKATFPRFLQMEQKYGSLVKAFLTATKMAPPPKPPAPGQPKKTFFMTFKEGMGELVNAMVKNMDQAKLLTGKSVTKIEEKIVNGQTRYTVSIEGMEPVEADAVIITALANDASELMKDVDREVSSKLAEIPLATSATVSIAFRKADVKVPLESYGFLVPAVEKRKIMATTYSSVKWQNRTPGDEYVLVRSFVGGARNQELVHQTDEEIIKMVRAELKDALGLTAEPVAFKITRWIKSMPQYVIGHLDRVEAIEKGVTRHPNLFLVGASYRGVGVGDCINVGTQAAEKAVENLK